MAINRSKQIIYNSFFGVISSFVSLASAYAIRIVISRVLGDDIYGINSMFYSVINTMLILELGISSAIVIFLYKPVELVDKEKTKSIVRFYRNVYQLFCLILLVGGIGFCSILQFFVHTEIDLNISRLYFFLYLIAIIVKYLFGYKKCLLFASQQNRIVTIVTAITELAFCGIGILCVVILKEYYIYLLVFIAQNIISNAICNIYVNKKFPYIKEKNICKIDSAFKKEMLMICRPLFVQRISNQINNSSSSIILGSFANVILVGFYSNYLLMVHAAQTIISQISNSFTSSFGNYMVYDSSYDEKNTIYKASRLGINAISMIGSCFFVGVADCVVSMLFGTNKLLNFPIVVLIGIYLYITLVSSIDLSVQNAIGQHRLDVKQMIIQTILTIGLSVLFGYFWNLTGIIIGNILPYLIFSYINKNYVVRKNIFRVKPIVIIKELFLEFIVFALGLALVVITNRFIYNMAFSLLIKTVMIGVLSIVEASLVYVICFYKSKSFKYLLCKILKKNGGGNNVIL